MPHRDSPRLSVKRVYEPPEFSDGTRVLVDRIWPRGLTKERATVHVWLKDIAPSTSLRIWFGHDPQRWHEFRERYFDELRANRTAVERMKELALAGKITLVFGARDTVRNHAVAIVDFLAVT